MTIVCKRVQHRWHRSHEYYFIFFSTTIFMFSLINSGFLLRRFMSFFYSNDSNIAQKALDFLKKFGIFLNFL
jgi:hypothetical protein